MKQPSEKSFERGIRQKLSAVYKRTQYDPATDITTHHYSDSFSFIQLTGNQRARIARDRVRELMYPAATERGRKFIWDVCNAWRRGQS